ncbi:hypothetical protein WICPIJ_002426 [Wickerhamomyces pijperi]|uniref:Uncharacterized protein n=1 Tax=Wickerhamomyces pijperi TaxID=599730 RepID=A0A9P8Q8Z8_WICPI|nr:hypothetical protein WICPIJ_002426 [Wickerhamomyces pijperi]
MKSPHMIPHDDVTIGIPNELSPSQQEINLITTIDELNISVVVTGYNNTVTNHEHYSHHRIGDPIHTNDVRYL